MSHARPSQVTRLVRTLRRGSPRCYVLVHHDYRKSHLDPEPLEEPGAVTVMRAVDPIEWGDFSIVAAALRALEWVHRHVEYDWIVLLSGQDYPVRPLAEIEAQLAASGHDAFVEVDAVLAPPRGMSHADADGGGLARRYYFRYARLPAPTLRAPALMRRVARRIALALSDHQPFVAVHPMPPGVPWRVGVRRRRTPFSADRPCVKGSFWMTLSRRAVAETLATIEREPALLRHYRRAILPDESLLQTLVLAGNGLDVSSTAVRYVSWPSSSSPNPRTLTAADLGVIVGSPAHFARKFDEQVDVTALDRLDRGET